MYFDYNPILGNAVFSLVWAWSIQLAEVQSRLPRLEAPNYFFLWLWFCTSNPMVWRAILHINLLSKILKFFCNLPFHC